MNFKKLQDMVLADAFDENDRGHAKEWINHRLAWLYDEFDWSFADKVASAATTQGSRTLTVPTDFAVAYDLWRYDGAPLQPILYDDYGRYYLGAGVGIPEVYTVLGTTVLVGPTASETRSDYQLSYQAGPTLLVNDNDEPNIPAGYHLALVHGAKAEGFKLNNVPLADALDADFTAAVERMQRKYIADSRPRGRQTPAYR